VESIPTKITRTYDRICHMRGSVVTCAMEGTQPVLVEVAKDVLRTKEEAVYFAEERSSS
jgi:predicted ATP-dependent serine protease